MEYLKGTQFIKKGQEEREERSNSLEKYDENLQETGPRQVTENKPSIQTEQLFQLKGSADQS